MGDKKIGAVDRLMLKIGKSAGGMKSKINSKLHPPKTVNKRKTFTAWLESYTKRLTTIIIAVALVDMQLSYVLAFMGCENIAESLSSTITTVIVGTVVGYLSKALFETAFAELIKYARDVNGIPDATPPAGDCVFYDTSVLSGNPESEPTVEMTDDDNYGN